MKSNKLTYNMLDSLILNPSSIESIYIKIKEYHNKFLLKYNVKLPKLKSNDGNYTKDSLVLVYLAYNYPATRVVSKEELTKFVRTYYPDTTDVQQARHLSAQKGFWIVAGGRDNIVDELKRGEYRLYTLEKPFPSFTQGHRISNTDDWGKIKSIYNFKCATCGSEEDKPHLHWPSTKTTLQKAHMDPNLPLISNNIIPQCQKCNRADKNKWVYDKKGRVVGIGSPLVIKNCSNVVKLNIYKILYHEFKGIAPESIKL